MLKCRYGISKMNKCKKGILFTVVVFIIMLPLFLLSISFSDKGNGRNDLYILYFEAEKLKFLESDVVTNVYSELLSISLSSIARSSSSIVIKFNQAILKPDLDYAKITGDYKNFIQTNYSRLNNVDISLIGFNHTFRIFPYNTTFEINGTALHLFTMPTQTNYISLITLNVKLNSSFDNGSGVPVNKQKVARELCQAPETDPAGNPSIKVIYVDKNEFSCTQSRKLNPTENNDDANGKQFYIGLINVSGSIETKFGEVNGIDGVLAVLTTNAAANVTQLDIEYAATESAVMLIGGNISITAPNVQKNTVIILAEE